MTKQTHTLTPWVIGEVEHMVINNLGQVNAANAAHIVRCVNSHDALLELAAEALWRRDYPNGGSIYKTYESLNFEDKELYRTEALAAAKGDA